MKLINRINTVVDSIAHYIADVDFYREQIKENSKTREHYLKEGYSEGYLVLILIEPMKPDFRRNLRENFLELKNA